MAVEDQARPALAAHAATDAGGRAEPILRAPRGATTSGATARQGRRADHRRQGDRGAGTQVEVLGRLIHTTRYPGLWDVRNAPTALAKESDG